MSDFNVELINKKFITPEFILARAWAARSEFRDILIVTIDKNGIMEMDTNNRDKLPQIAEILTKAGARHLISQEEKL